MIIARASMILLIVLIFRFKSINLSRFCFEFQSANPFRMTAAQVFVYLRKFISFIATNLAGFLLSLVFLNQVFN